MNNLDIAQEIENNVQAFDILTELATNPMINTEQYEAILHVLPFIEIELERLNKLGVL